MYHGCICFSNAFLCTLHTSCWLTQVKSACLSSSSVTVEVAEIVVKSVIFRLNIIDFQSQTMFETCSNDIANPKDVSQCLFI